MKAKKAHLGLLVTLLEVLALLAAACGDGGEPERRSFEVKLHENMLEPGRIVVNHEDIVILEIEAHQAGEIHLHGYDITADVEAGQVHDMEFVAFLEGRFIMTLHPRFGALFQSGILENGDTFSYTIPDPMAATVIPYHSHLQPELTGSVAVSHEGGQQGLIEVRITDTGIHPHMVMAAPGATIRWTNESSALQTVHAGSPAEHGHETGEEGGHGTEGGGEVQEIEVGVLEVHPR